MINALVALLIVVLVVGIVVAVVIWAIDAIPIPAPFNRIAKVIIILIAVLIILAKALPMLGVSGL